MTITITDEKLRKAAEQGADEFLQTVTNAIISAGGGELNADSMALLSADQITLWGYHILHEELSDGGFVQLIYNGYGPFFFDNPFAKAMRLWGLHDFSKLLYKAKKAYDVCKHDFEQERTDEEFMALFEQHPEFDELDDEFIENEETITLEIVHYVDEHLDNFVKIQN